MLRCFLLVALCFPLQLFAQNVRMVNGKLMADNTVYATYEEISEKKHTLKLTGELLDYNPESMGSNFSDYIFSSTEGEQMIFATARVMASPYRGRLIYYYNIQFGTLETQLNTEYHLYNIENLGKDIVKYKLIKDNKLDEDAVNTLVRAWKKKPNAINDEQLKVSSRTTYNNSPYHVASEIDKSPLVIKDHNIYYNDSLIATYHIAKTIAVGSIAGTSKNDFYYYIDYINGNTLGELHLNMASPYIRIWAAPEKLPYRVYTAEREEVNLIKVAVISLLEHKQQLAYSNNK